MYYVINGLRITQVIKLFLNNIVYVSVLIYAYLW